MSNSIGQAVARGFMPLVAGHKARRLHLRSCFALHSDHTHAQSFEPAIMAAEALSSYDSVVSYLEELANSSPADLKHVAHVLASVLTDQKQVLLTKSIEAQVVLSNEQQKAMAGAIVDAAHYKFAARAMKESATTATNEVNAVELMFSSLLQELSGIDSNYHGSKPKEGEFVARLKVARGVKLLLPYSSRICS